MVERRLTFHVPPEAEPRILISLLEVIRSERASFDSVGSLLDFARYHSLTSRTEVHIFASDCGLLERLEDGGVGLSSTAVLVLELKPEVRPDVIHFLAVSGWQAEHPRERTALWSYRQAVNLFWERPDVDLSKSVNVYAEEIRNQVQVAFENDPSFGPKSIRGVRKWLEALTPPVIENDRFVRRHFCPPELMLLGLGWIGRTSGGDIGVDVLLTPERRDGLCRVCLLDPCALDRVLDWTLPLYPTVIRPGTGAGVYGRFVRFLKWPELRDLLR